MNKKEFQETISKVLEKDPRLSNIENRYGRRQYEGIYWIHADFADNVKMKEGYEKVVGINIMPYRITNAIIKTANPSDPAMHPFKDQKEGFCDLDLISGNFHVKKDPNDISMQIVLTVKNTKGLGPGFDSAKPINKLSCIRTNYFFPPIKSRSKDIVDEKGLISTLDSLLKKIIE